MGDQARRNQHRSGQGWAKSAVRSILLNRKYTGREVYGKQPTSYELLDPQDPSFGDEKVQRWADPASWIVSARGAHPAILADEVFEAAQGRFAARETAVKTKPRVSRHEYLLKEGDRPSAQVPHRLAGGDQAGRCPTAEGMSGSEGGPAG